MLDQLSDTLTGLMKSLTGRNRVSEKNVRDAVEEIKRALLDADVNLRVVRRFVNRTLQDAVGETVLNSVSPGQQFIKIVRDRLVQLLGDEHQDLVLRGPDVVSTILLMGLQGSGKTTSAAKLAHRLRAGKRRPLLVAADLVRPAAIEQLVVLGRDNDLPVFRLEGATSPIDVVKAARREAETGGYDTMIVDTSGRLQVDEALMAELRAVRDLLSPDEALLVADSMTGQNAVEIAKAFDESIGVTGIVLSKFDSDTRGGAALSLKSVTGKAIKFVGVGEKIDALEPFHPDRTAGRILGMGDVVTLVEKAQEQIDAHEAAELQKKIAKASFTLQDYLDQFARVKKMGSMQSVLSMFPGMTSEAIEDSIDEDAMKREEAIILSMTIDERLNHKIIGPGRRRRIAKGSGTSVHAVSSLIKKFEKTRTMMKRMTKDKKYQARMMSQLQG